MAATNRGVHLIGRSESTKQSSPRGRAGLLCFAPLAMTGSHIRIIRPAAAFGRYPVDVLVGVLDVAGFAVDAVLRVDDVARLAALLDPFVDAGRAIARRRSGIDVVLGGFLQIAVTHQEMHRLVLL